MITAANILPLRFQSLSETEDFIEAEDIDPENILMEMAIINENPSQ
jgi:hypothetical protein